MVRNYITKDPNYERAYTCGACGAECVQKGPGRPRKLCGDPECEKAWRRHMDGQARKDAAKYSVAAMKAWWLGLNARQREAAMLWVRDNPPTKYFIGRQNWACLQREQVMAAYPGVFKDGEQEAKAEAQQDAGKEAGQDGQADDQG